MIKSALQLIPLFSKKARNFCTYLAGWLLLNAFTNECAAQKISRYNSFSYNVNEGLLQSHVNDIVFDKNNFGWLSFENGLQRFDGEHFTDVPPQNGLPDNKEINLLRCSNGDLLFSHSSGISKYEKAGNKFQLVYKGNYAIKTPAVLIGEDNSVAYFFTSDGYIVGLDIQHYNVVSKVQTGYRHVLDGLAFATRFSDNIIDHHIAIAVDSHLELWDLQGQKSLYKIRMDTLPTFTLHLKNGWELLYEDGEDASRIASVNFQTGLNRVVKNLVPDDAKVFRAVFFNWQKNEHFTHHNHVYKVTAGYENIHELVNLQNKPIAGNAVIFKTRQDNYGNLYLLTVNDGLRKLISNNYPIKYYGTEVKENNYIISVCADKPMNRIIAGTYGKGLLIFDTLQQLVKHVTTFPGTKNSFSPNGILKTGPDEYLVFLWAKRSAWIVTDNFEKFTEVPFHLRDGAVPESVNYFGNALSRDAQNIWFQARNNFYKVRGKNIDEFSAGISIGLGSTISNGQLITHHDNELVFFDTGRLAVNKVVPLNNTGGVRSIVTDSRGNILVGSNNGLYRLNAEGQLIEHLNKDRGLPDDCIYSILVDAADNVWCSSNKGIFKIESNDKLLLLKKDDGLQENEFNTNVTAAAADGELFFGGVNGVSSFFPQSIRNFEEKINLLFTGINVNNHPVIKDTAAWNINDIELPYDRNSLSFDFVAMAANAPSQYVYQYQMKGVDEEWIPANGLQTVRYNLSPGKYIFRIYASRFFNKDAIASKEITIYIHAPFWRTWWFFSLLSVLLVAIAFYTFKRYEKRRYTKRLDVFEGEQKILLERERISRELHDNIGAYANAVLYNTELLEQEDNQELKKSLMQDLKFASKDIITSLRETIWAFKKDSYTAEDCLLRIKNFVQPFTRYYTKINFKVEGAAPDGVVLHYSKALNLVRTVQEAVTNAIKHSNTKTIEIKSHQTADHWIVSIIDKGEGFDVTMLPKNDSGDGLQNMKQRALDSGFGFRIITENLPGTTIELMIDLPVSSRVITRN